MFQLRLKDDDFLGTITARFKACWTGDLEGFRKPARTAANGDSVAAVLALQSRPAIFGAAASRAHFCFLLTLR
jgi:hypothetical protein